jgi:hypothetical protein
MLDLRSPGDYGEASGQSRPSAYRRVAALGAPYPEAGEARSRLVYWEVE